MLASVAAAAIAFLIAFGVAASVTDVLFVESLSCTLPFVVRLASGTSTLIFPSAVSILSQLSFKAVSILKVSFPSVAGSTLYKCKFGVFFGILYTS
ncbi:hypothetical protein D3C71_1265990 [compost metagenome]